MYIPYITLQDYFAVIQQDQLNNQLLDSVTDGIINSTRDRIFAENWAMGQIRSKIGDIYDIDLEFTETKPYAADKSYTGGDRVTLDFPAWTIGTRYDLNSLVIRDGKAWICLAEPSDGAWDEGQWMSFGNQYDTYYVKYPEQLFQYLVSVDRYGNISGKYNVGDKVFWQGKIYSCKYTTSIPSREDLLNRQDYLSLDAVNHFPTDTSYWTFIEDYVVLNNTPTTDSDIWVYGDNRDAQIVQAVIDLSLFQLHKRISPRNIPQMRIDSMKDQMAFLYKISSEEETLTIPTLPAKRGSNFSWGSKPKAQNGWQ